MHLEQALAAHADALAANTAALQALTAALAANPMQAPSAQPAPIPAPSFAAVVPPPIAPVVSTDTSPAPTTAFAPPVPTVPSVVPTAAPPMAPPAASGNVERDSKGMPYDGRIHSSSKAKVADGSWRYKRGTGDTYIKQVEDELRGAAAAPAVGGTVHAVTPAGIGDHAAAPVVGGVGTPWPFPDEQQPPVAVAVPSVPVAAVPPAPVAPPVVVAPPPAAVVAAPVAAAAGMTYESLMQALPTKIVSGELSAQQLQQACEQFGVPSIAALQARPDLVPHVAAVLGIK